MTQTRIIVFRLCGQGLDGEWMEVEAKPPPWFMQNGDKVVELVATGDVEFEGNETAEVFVPVGKLAEWRATTT